MDLNETRQYYLRSLDLNLVESIIDTVESMGGFDDGYPEGLHKRALILIRDICRKGVAGGVESKPDKPKEQT